MRKMPCLLPSEGGQADVGTFLSRFGRLHVILNSLQTGRGRADQVALSVEDPDAGNAVDLILFCNFALPIHNVDFAQAEVNVASSEFFELWT